MIHSMRTFVRLAALAVGLAGTAPAWAATATIDCPGGTLSFANNTLTCTVDTTPPPAGAPSGCSLTASPSSGGPAAQNVTLTAACTSGTTPITLAWTGSGTGSCNTAPSGLSQTCVISGVAANTSWSVNFSNSAGNNNKSANYTYNAGGSTDPFAGCPNGTLKIDNVWGANAIETAQYGTFGNNMMSIHIKVPSTATGTNLRTTSWVEYAAGPVVREAVFSTKPCDFTTTNALKNYYGAAMRSVDNIRFSFAYRIGSPGASSTGLTAGQSYFLNVRNYKSTGELTCSISDCSMRGGVED